MSQMNIIQAINDALKLEMRRNPDVVVLGEDVGKFGGVFRATAGLYDEFGDTRVIDTPLAEAGIIGASIGMAMYGLRPVPEIQFADFIYPAFDQIINELAKLRYRSGGEWTCPVTIRTPYGGGIRGGHYHSQSPEALFAHIPGLKVVIPSSPYDAKGLLLSSIRDDDPVLFMEPKRVYRAARGEVPEGEDYTIPLSSAKIIREGRHCTVLSYGAMIHTCLEAVPLCESDGYDVELIDLRTLVPWDRDTVMSSVRKTGRCVVVVEAPRTASFAGELIAEIQENCFLSLESPIGRVTGYDTPFPHTLEHLYLPDAERIRQTVTNTMTY
ncbi:MAG: alpha-ketoacid dehydrogenase subunit beta [Myxococcales bacterium]|nr:alpha-ketoacid dehydrogenase subunit beta [Myxococcales bacterium]